MSGKSIFLRLRQKFKAVTLEGNNYHITMKSTITLIIALLLFACSSGNKKTNSATEVVQPEIVKTKKEIKPPVEINHEEFTRETSLNRIKDKIQSGKPLVVHLRIPLCDNENQGIVRVPEKLGNGFDLKSNLYWGAKYGFKNHFKRHANWKLISSEKDRTNTILERVIFKKVIPNKTDVYIVADAYKGDAMKECLEDFFKAVSGKSDEEIEVENVSLGIGSNADLIIFNGHNGLMDYTLELTPSEDQVIREVSAIGCISHSYFKEHLLTSKGYPVLMTTNLMAPEAYVLEAVIESWMNLKTEQLIRKNAGIAYDKYQNCGVKGATRLFKYGW
jgi:hypothetical protein